MAIAPFSAATAQTVSPEVYEDLNSNGSFDTGEENSGFSNGNGGGTSNRAFDIVGGDTTTPIIIVEFDYVDNSFILDVNGSTLCLPTICQLQANVFNPANDAFLQASSGALAAPWLPNSNGLPRVRVTITATSYTVVVARARNSTSLETGVLTSGSFGPLPVFVQGQNTITVINPNDNGPDRILGNIAVTYEPLEVDLRITKTNTPGVNGNVDLANDTVISGSQTTYHLVVTNYGPDPVSGALVTDVPSASLSCPSTDTLSITGDGVPSGTHTIGDLVSSGVSLGALAVGQSATISYSCTVN